MNKNDLIPRLVLEQWDAVDDHVKRAALEKALSTAPQWQPISTAPKDGTVVDLWCRRTSESGCTTYCRYTDCKWGAPYNQLIQRNDSEQWLGISELYAVAVPTHWMPLAELPVTEETEE